MSFDKKFYDEWARAQLSEPNREIIMKTSARLLYEMWEKYNPFSRKNYTCAEIGGAEGTLLNEFARLTKLKKPPINFELSHKFVVVGRKWYPKIKFVQGDFSRYNGPKMDLILLSDIVEHIQDDAKFLESIADSADYVLLKIPIEKTIYSRLLQVLKKSSPVGPGHPSGHLHAYTVNSALNLCSNQFKVLEARKINFFEAGNPISTKSSKILFYLVRLLHFLGLDVDVFGGALILLLKSKRK